MPDNEPDAFYCPYCGPIPYREEQKSLREIETVDNGDEWKTICSCDVCNVIVHIFMRKG